MTAFEFVWETFQIGVDNYNLGYVWEDCIVSLKISVIVLQNGETLGQKANKRPVRVMPDGISGVVFNGCVYPVYCDLTIETNDPCYEPSECTTFVENEKEIVYKDNSNPISKNINLKWTTQFSPSRKYLLFDSDEIFAEKLFSILENEGLAHRLAESFKPAKDGYFYDWFICTNILVTEDDFRSEFINILNKFTLRDVHGIETNDSSQKQISDLQDELNRQVDDLKDQLEEMNNDLIKKTVLLKIKDHAAINYQESINDLEEKIKQLQITTPVKSISHKENNTSKNELNTYEDLLNEADENIKELNENISKMSEDILKFEQNIKDKDLIIEKNKTDLKKIPNNTKQLKEFAWKTNNFYLNRLRFEDEDIQLLIYKVKNKESFFQPLKKINDGEDCHSLGAKKINKFSVWSIHVNNTGIPGKNDMGRIYWQKNTDGSIKIALHLKENDKEQELFLKRRF